MLRVLEVIAILATTLFVIRWVFNGIGEAWKARIEANREAKRLDHEREMMREARSLAMLLQASPEIADSVEAELSALRHKRARSTQNT